MTTTTTDRYVATVTDDGTWEARRWYRGGNACRQDAMVTLRAPNGQCVDLQELPTRPTWAVMVRRTDRGWASWAPCHSPEGVKTERDAALACPDVTAVAVVNLAK